MLARISERRFWVIHIGVIAIFLLITGQLIRLSFIERDALLQLVDRQHSLVVEIKQNRGRILDRNMKELAMNIKVPSIYAVPRIIRDKEEMARTLSKILDKDKAFIMSRIERDKAFVWLKRHASQKEADAIRDMKSQKLGIVYENKRLYPNGELFANIIGFCDIDNQGIEGIEMIHDKFLKGRTGYRFTKRDALGREVVAFEEKLVPPVDGANITLTIDQYIQYLTERSLDEAFKKWKAKGASAVVMNPNTGEILAMANRPTFNPNESISAGDPAERRNRAITDIYEPGSVFKIVTAAAAFDAGKVSIADQFNCEKGTWQITRSRVIHDVHPYGMLTFPQVMQKSSNIGTVKIAMRLGEKGLYEYIRKFGFGQQTGIDLPGEVNGIVHPLNKWSKISITSVPYGQEVAATGMQMLNAVSVIANGGRLVRPFMIREIKDNEGVVLKQTEPMVRQMVVEPETAEVINEMLQLVVGEGGTGKAAAIKGIKVAGKTGTSQKLENGTYSHSKHVGSFVGYAPADNPMLAMLVVIDEPRGAYYGGVVAAPVFQEVIEDSLRYLGYFPNEEPESKLKTDKINQQKETAAKKVVSSPANPSIPVTAAR